MHARMLYWQASSVTHSLWKYFPSVAFKLGYSLCSVCTPLHHRGDYNHPTTPHCYLQPLGPGLLCSHKKKAIFIFLFHFIRCCQPLINVFTAPPRWWQLCCAKQSTLSTHFMKLDLGSISSSSCVLTAKPDVDIWESKREKNVYFNNQKKREERHQQSLHSDAIKKAIRAQSVAQIYLCRKLSHFKPGPCTERLATLREVSFSFFQTALQSLALSLCLHSEIRSATTQHRTQRWSTCRGWC